MKLTVLVARSHFASDTPSTFFRMPATELTQALQHRCTPLTSTFSSARTTAFVEPASRRTAAVTQSWRISSLPRKERSKPRGSANRGYPVDAPRSGFILRRTGDGRLLPSPTKGRGEKRASGQDVPYHLAVHVGQAEIAAAVAIRQPLVIQPHQVQDRRVQVMDVHTLLDRLIAEFVGGAVGQP